MGKKQKSGEEDPKDNKVNEPEIAYPKKRSIRIFHSIDEAEEADRLDAFHRTPEERLLLLRKSINIAYGMHGYDPAKIPAKRSFRIVRPID